MKERELMMLLESLKIRRLRVSGNNVTGCCPIHGERNPSFGVAVHKEHHPYGCFACGAKGSLMQLVATMLSCSFADAKKYILRFGAYDLDYAKQSALLGYADRFALDMADVQLLTNEVMGAFQPPSLMERAILLRKGITSEMVAEAGLRSQRGDQLIVFPWHAGVLGKIVGVTARGYGTSHRVKGLPLLGFTKHRYLYRGTAMHPTVALGGDPTGWVIVVEGELDVLALRHKLREHPTYVKESPLRHPGTQVVGLGGHTITEEQASTLSDMGDRVLILLDRDSSGDSEPSPLECRIAERLGSRVVSYRAIPVKEYSDPAKTAASALLRMLDVGNLAPIYV